MTYPYIAVKTVAVIAAVLDFFGMFERLFIDMLDVFHGKTRGVEWNSTYLEHSNIF